MKYRKEKRAENTLFYLFYIFSMLTADPFYFMSLRDPGRLNQLFYIYPTDTYWLFYFFLTLSVISIQFHLSRIYLCSDLKEKIQSKIHFQLNDSGVHT